uniref:Metallo-beta-lactamase domain-containing protein n=1 Tax=Anopheles stephensi TaxID=30069 RepID=A0A182Y3A1_ANOST
MNEIIILSEGYSRYEMENPAPDAPMLANCTCTLIKGPDCNVLVDTMTPWDGDLLLQPLDVLEKKKLL